MIFDSVWGYDLNFASNSLEVYIGYLRGRPRKAVRLASSRRSAASAMSSAPADAFR